ncbi:sigma-70 family RNA polymerase sigma factor [Calditerricola satsumensis]|uniref:sigma-70 family RNA polymerase sigma factor n=1 Tax=Calditerricola satsumensis TaxID=373054 RepID=UPI00166BB4F2|nr:sigma-70 family RNA polymerase sigma factor [Calditerricola satsumensis]
MAHSRRIRTRRRARLARVEQQLNVRLPIAVGEDEATLRFLEAVAVAPVHTRPEEQELIRRVQELGDPAACDALVRGHLRHVVAVAVRFQGRGLSLMDLIQEGVIGLLAAIARFDRRRRVRLAHYARWWIAQAIARAVHDKGDRIRLPVHMHVRLREYRTCATRLAQELGRFPRPDEVATALQTSEGEVNQLRAPGMGVARCRRTARRRIHRVAGWCAGRRGGTAYACRRVGERGKRPRRVDRARRPARASGTAARKPPSPRAGHSRPPFRTGAP